jgi:hypothetical protein
LRSKRTADGRGCTLTITNATSAITEKVYVDIDERDVQSLREVADVASRRTITRAGVFGLVCPQHVTGGSMAPAICPGDHVLMEKIAFFVRSPRRGDIVVFRAVSMPPFEDGVLYPKRVVGAPRGSSVAGGRKTVRE